MSINFLEIKNTTFVASKLNKVFDFNLTIKNEGDIICLLGPSGVGKDAILTELKNHPGNYLFTLTATTRKIRPGENNGRDYIFLSAKKFKEAITEYQNAIGLNPRQVEAHNGIGLAYTMTQKYDLAVSAQQRALELDQNLAEAHAGLGLIYFLTDQQEKAL